MHQMSRKVGCAATLLATTVAFGISMSTTALAVQTISVSGPFSAVEDLGGPVCYGVHDTGYAFECRGTVYIHHVEEHEFAGGVSGTWEEDATLLIDTTTGNGIITGTGTFTGSVDGHSGTMTLTIVGTGTNIAEFSGTWYGYGGTGGLQGIGLQGTWAVTVGGGAGTYAAQGYLP